jgi:hypothetical protein
MKLLTGILVFLSAFILGYSLAGREKLPTHLYVIEGKDIYVKWRGRGKEKRITLNKPPETFFYFSKEKPKQTTISRDEFLKNWQDWQDTKGFSRESFFVSIVTPHSLSKIEQALVQDIRYSEPEKSLTLTVMFPSIEREENDSKNQNPHEDKFSHITLHLFQAS